MPVATGQKVAPSYTSGSATQPALYLSRPTVLAIYVLNITYWNDSAIQADNPTIVLPFQPIVLVLRSDSSGTTNTFQQYLLVVATSLGTGLYSSHPYYNNTLQIFSSPASTWTNDYLYALKPQSYMSTNRVLMANGNYQGAAIVQFTSYSLAYLSAPFLNGLKYASMQTSWCANLPVGATCSNPKGISATTITTQNAIAYGYAMGSKSGGYANSYVASTSPVGNLLYTIDAYVDNAWPIAEFNYVLIPDIVSSDCSRALQVAQFLVWSLQSPTAQAAMIFLANTPMPTNAQAAVVNQITKLNCGTLSAPQQIFNSLRADQAALIIVSYIAAAYLFILAILAAIKFNHPAIMAKSAPILVYVGLGTGAATLTVTAFVGYPTDFQCRAKPILRLFSLVPITGIMLMQLKILFGLNYDVVKAATETDASVELGAVAPVKEAPAAVEAPVAPVAPVAAAADDEEEDNKPQIVRLDTSQAAMAVYGIMAFVAFITMWFPLGLAVGPNPAYGSQRECQSTDAPTVSILVTLWNIILVAATAVVAYRVKDLETVVEPLYIILLDIALFFPMEYLNVDPAFPDLRTTVLILQPAVGILAVSLLEGSLLLLPAIIKAYQETPENYLAMVALELQVKKFAISARKSTRAASSKRSGSESN